MPQEENAPPAEEDANSGLDYEDGEDASSPEGTAHNNDADGEDNSAGQNPKKRKREKYQKTSYVTPLSIPSSSSAVSTSWRGLR